MYQTKRDFKNCSDTLAMKAEVAKAALIEWARRHRISSKIYRPRLNRDTMILGEAKKVCMDLHRMRK